MEESTNIGTAQNSMANTGDSPTTCCVPTFYPSLDQKNWIKKDWGKAFPLYKDDQVRIVRIEIERAWVCSLHHHKDCDNTFQVVSGMLEVIEYPGDGYARYYTLHGDSPPHVVRAGMNHRFRSHSKVVCIETYTARPGAKIDENDIVRLEPGKRVSLEY